MTHRSRVVRRRSRAWQTSLLTLVIAARASGISVAQIERSVERLSGQTVAPVYDGYEINADGTYSLWFSYFNRNRRDAVDVPVGPDNRFEPGPADRGQPTHFVPLWQKSSFRVILPKDFGAKTLTWHLTTQGTANQVVATINPKAIIDRQKETLDGGAEGENKAPVVTVGPATQVIARTESARFTAAATDDGKPQNAITKKPDGLTVRWRKYRGPSNGVVTFSSARASLSAGEATTSATFSAPGEYVIQAVIDDGSLLTGTYCCWVNTELKVTVKP